MSEETKDCPGCRSKRLVLETNDATGYLYSRCAAGPVIASNIFLQTALIYLAKKEAGCLEEGQECAPLYGFKNPISIISLSAVVAGLLTAFFLPFCGAVVDYTSHRRLFGIVASIILVTIQAIQIGTVESTWFIMTILQSINGFVYNVINLVVLSYLPEIAAVVQEKTFFWYNSLFYIQFFAHQVAFIVTIVAIAIITGLTDNYIGQIGQAIDSVVTAVYFAIAWYFLSHAPARRTLPEDQSLVGAGFWQVLKTTKGIYKHYPKSMGWFFLGLVFIEAGVGAFTSVSVIYLSDQLEFSSTKLGIAFIILLLATVPGACFSSWLANKTNPISSMKLQVLCFIIVNFVAFTFVTEKEDEIEAFVLFVIWGFLIGWIYPVENMVFAKIVPANQESELAGFYLYCSMILNWLPPLIFTIMTEKGVPLNYGGMHLNIYLCIGLCFLQLICPWSECVEQAKENKMIVDKGNHSNDDV